MPKPEANQQRAPLAEVLSNASAANDAADVERVAKDLSEAVANGLAAEAPVPAATPAPAPARKHFTAHSQAASERLLTEERALADTLNDLDAKILELTDQRDDAYRAYAAVQGARQALGGAN